VTHPGCNTNYWFDETFLDEIERIVIWVKRQTEHILVVVVQIADKFDEGLRALNLGSRYSGSTSGSIEWVFALVEPLAQEIRDQLVREVGPSQRVPEILAGVNDDSTFNAIALPSPIGGYIIAVNYGALILLHDLVHRLFCLPEFFPWVGDPSKEDRNRQFHPTCNDALVYMRKVIADPRGARPRERRRELAAVALIPLAVMFLVAHEFRHIIGGHLDWLKTHYGKVSISEILGIEGDPHDGLALQALEMDADEFAMYYTLMRALQIASRPEEDVSPSYRGIITTPLQALQAVLACALVMIGTFFRPPGPPEEWRTYSHPPSGVRHGMNVLGADGALQSLGQEDLRATTTANQEWLALNARFTLSHLAQRLGNTDRQEGLRLELGPRGQQHLLEIFQSWGRIRNEVSACASELLK